MNQEFEKECVDVYLHSPYFLRMDYCVLSMTFTYRIL